VHTAGYTLGALLYLQYVEPSPVCSHELIWISSLVRCTDPRYDVPPGWGPLYYVARMYVDNPSSIAAGEQEWGLPKSPAVFERHGNTIRVDAEDGTELQLSFRPRGFSFTAPTRISTIQNKRDRVVRFKARGRAEAQLATYTLDHFVSGHEDWQSFGNATRLPGLATLLKSFQTTLQAPRDVPRRMESLRPAALPF